MSAVPHSFYYLENFQRVLDWIEQRYSDLLSGEEQNFILQFPALPQASRALLIRMVMRKGEFFRATKLRYEEIGCPEIAAQALVDAGWLTMQPLLSLHQMCGLLRKAEIVDAFRLSTSKAKKKSELLDELSHEFSELRPFSEWWKSSDERTYQVNVTNLCDRLRLIFFGNLHQDWSEFVLADLGIYRYEQIELLPSSRGFHFRQDVDVYLHLHRCRERLDEGDYLDEILSDIPAHSYENSWLEGCRNKLLFKIARQYERCGESQRALDIYSACDFSEARQRSIRVLEKCEKNEEAFDLAGRVLADPASEAEHQAVLRMWPRLRRKVGLEKAATLKKNPVDSFTLSLPYPASPISVELLAQAHFSNDIAPAFYVENALINSLFGLLCWPAVFAAVPGAFFHPFHRAPADLHSPDFLEKRRAIFETCLSQLDTERYRQTILENFHRKPGIQSPFVFWGAIDEALLMLALRCIPAMHLKKYFERILWDIPSNRSGFPDLIQFWPEEKRYRMLEVKGPSDRLQDNQIRWINYCVDHQFPVAVCYVQWSEQVA